MHLWVLREWPDATAKLFPITSPSHCDYWEKYLKTGVKQLSLLSSNQSTQGTAGITLTVEGAGNNFQAPEVQESHQE